MKALTIDIECIVIGAKIKIVHTNSLKYNVKFEIYNIGGRGSIYNGKKAIQN